MNLVYMENATALPNLAFVSHVSHIESLLLMKMKGIQRLVTSTIALPIVIVIWDRNLNYRNDQQLSTRKFLRNDLCWPQENMYEISDRKCNMTFQMDALNFAAKHFLLLQCEGHLKNLSIHTFLRRGFRVFLHSLYCL